MSDPTVGNRSGPGTERPPPDDWQLDDIDWFEETGERSSGRAPASPAADDAGRKSRIGLIPGAGSGREPAEVEARSALIRRRRVAGLVVLGVIFAAALVIPLVVFGGGGDGNAAEQTTPLTTAVQTATAPRTTTREQPATTTTPPSTTSGASPLRVVLPAGTTLHRGDRGSAVLSLQKGLAALGFATGEPDGVFGATTEAAVVDFQQSNNLPPDGIVGSDTVRLLNAALSAR